MDSRDFIVNNTLWNAILHSVSNQVQSDVSHKVRQNVGTFISNIEGIIIRNRNERLDSVNKKSVLRSLNE